MSNTAANGGDEGLAPDYLGGVYGETPPPPLVRRAKKTDFAPWHHPVKQIVRDYQWGALTEKLVQSRKEDARGILRYFTLPGADLLDVRYLSKKLEAHNSKIEYFGFNQGQPDEDPADAEAEKGTYFSAESALRQAGKTTGNAVVLPDRLEDIANPNSQAANRLRQQGVFDVINIDACNHLGFSPEGRTQSLFDAMGTLLAHQLRAEKPWLLFVTTRVAPDLLGTPAITLQSAINDNIKLHPDFGGAVAQCIKGNIQTLAGDLNKSWGQNGESFLKMFVLGVAKYLLQFFHGQPNLQAKVELASAYAYRVYGDEPDMLSLAFRVSPSGLKVHPHTAGTAVVGDNLELGAALAVVERLSKLWLLDGSLDDEQVKSDAVLGTHDLLDAADYDIAAWEAWLKIHKIRPMEI
ncbi:MAG TPA: hypothetical protein ENH55_09900 [Aurantimonas coralicida]|uniref:Uncharacterized protein n=2 Tax=root TaxID=1 RepID=A0A9C9THY2_9HYPH|nr:hypothetical protein [Aurantimonas coralicida]HEU01950.1 hypothetical protein [Aurantimonas coralicida]